MCYQDIQIVVDLEMYRYGNWVNRLNMNFQLQYVITKLAYLATRLNF